MQRRRSAVGQSMLLPPPPPLQSRLPPGIRFNPTPEEVVGYYLSRWIAGAPLHDTEGIIHPADVYGANPDELTKKFPPGNKLLGHWFFVSARKWKSGAAKHSHRLVEGGGSWHTEQSKKPVVKNGAVIGYRQSFKYYVAKGRKSPWLMEEFVTCAEEAAAFNGGNGKAPVRVLCKIYQSPRAVGKKRTAAAEDCNSWCRDDAKRIRTMPVLPPPPPSSVPDHCQVLDVVVASSDRMSIGMDELLAFLDSGGDEAVADQETDPPLLLTYGGDGAAAPQPHHTDGLAGSANATGDAIADYGAWTWMSDMLDSGWSDGGMPF